MNAQRWLALGLVVLIVVCIATSNIWLTPLLERSEETPVTPTPQGTSGTEEDGTPFPLTPTPTPTLDPAIADIMADLGMEQMGVGIDPHIIMAGNFTTIDAMHRAEGMVSIYRFSETQRVLRLDPFSVTTGPDLHVLLSEHKAPRTSAEALLPTYVDLGILRSASGAQNYEIPTETDLSRYHSVVIYSMSLNIVYSTATLSEVRGR